MKRIALATGVLLLLAGCSIFHKTPAALPGCPSTGLVHGASFYPVLAGTAAHQAPGDLAASARFESFTGDCKFRKGQPGVDVSLTLNFAGAKGPRGEKLETQAFPYFVAVLSPDEQILQRQVFTTKIDFDKTGTGTSSEEQRIHIPLTDNMQAPGYKIAAGFALNLQQDKYNKENHAD